MDSSELDPHLIHGFLDPNKSAPKWHLDRFICFCRAHLVTNRQTDTQTEHAIPFVATVRILYSACDVA